MRRHPILVRRNRTATSDLAFPVTIAAWMGKPFTRDPNTGEMFVRGDTPRADPEEIAQSMENYQQGKCRTAKEIMDELTGG